MKKVTWPKISLILLTKNGGEGVRDILDSVKRQSYNQNLIEIIVVDDGSTDKSVAIAKEYTSHVFVNPNKGLYINWIVGLHKVTGDFVYYVEQDIQLRGTSFFQKMLLPLIEDKTICASFTRKYPRSDQSWVTQFLSYHPSQCDPLYEFLTPPIEKSFLEEKKGYILCKFKLETLSPFARMFYRMEYLKRSPNWKVKEYFDHDFVIQMIKSGFDRFAYVPEAGLYHYHAKSLTHLLTKRARNLDIHYFPYNHETEYKWLDTNDKRAIMKMIFWVIYANLLFPAAMRGIYRAIKFKSWVLLTEPIITISVTDVILWKFLKNGVGRTIIKNSLTTLFGTK